MDPETSEDPPSYESVCEENALTSKQEIFLKSNLSDSFDDIIAKIEEGRNIAMICPAGTGKSYTLNKILEHYMDTKMHIASTATTGIASLLYTKGLGTTLHKQFKLRPASTRETYFDDWGYKKHKEDFKLINILMIDEISMLRCDLFEFVSMILCRVHNNTLPFGGIQVILSGDVLQLSPVNKENLDKVWCFESDLWKKLNLFYVDLGESKRQIDPLFRSMLDKLRVGDITDELEEYFKASENHVLPKERRFMKLMTTNAKVDAYNKRRLDEIPGDAFTFKAKVEAQTAVLEKELRDSIRALDKLQFKIGSQVVLIANHANGLYVNGNMGLIRGVTPINSCYSNKMEIMVLLYCNDREIKVTTHDFKLEKPVGRKLKVVATFSQYPIRLADACSFHSAQGCTFDYVEVDLANSYWASSIAYVGISRARTYEGLRVLNWNASAINYDRKAVKFIEELEMNRLKSNIDVLQIDKVNLA